MRRIAIIGAGGWGTALAVLAGRARHDVRIWSRNENVVGQIEGERVNEKYLPGQMIPSCVRATCDVAEALSSAEIVILAAPSHAIREMLSSMIEHVRPSMTFVSATKGIEIETGKRISEVAAEVLGQSINPVRFVALSGPSFAKEAAQGQPTAIVAASDAEELARCIQEDLSVQNFRIYTNRDVVGTEMGGALKNVMALAAGMVAGLGFGTNSIAALITRGLVEMTRLALTKGARPETLMGLAGLGDLVLTCTGSLSRNRFVGQELGRGRRLEDVLADMHEIAEGVKTTRAVKLLATRVGAEMPITDEVHAVLYENKHARVAAEALMSRPLREEV